MKTLRGWSRLALVAAVALAARQAGAQVMDQVPDNAMVVVKVASLQKTSGKIASLAQKIGIAQMVPQLQDPMGALTKKLHDPKGLNQEGEMAFIFLNPESAGGDGEKSMVVLLPVSDYKAFLTNMPDAKTDDASGVTEGKIAGQGDTTYAAHWGDYAAVSPSRDVVAKKPAAMLKLQGVAAKEAADKDLFVYANMVQIRAVAIPALQKNREMILSKAEKAITEMQHRQQAAVAPPAGDNAPPPLANVQAGQAVKAIINQGLNLAQQFLQDTQSVSYGINLSDDGIKSSLVAEFEANSYLGQFAAGAKKTDQSLLTGLPAGNYLMFGGVTVDPERAAKMIDDLGTPVIKDLKAAGVDTAAIDKYLAATKQFYASTNSVHMGVVAPGGALGQEAMIQTVGVIDGKPDEAMPAMRDMAASQADIGKLFGQPQDQTKVTVTNNAKTVDGVSFDRVQTTFNFGANNPQAAQIQQMMSIMYGPDGMNMFSGKVDDKHLLVSMGTNDEFLAKAIKAAKANDDSLDKMEQLKAVNAQLPANRMGVVYIPLDNFVTTGVAYAKSFGMPIQLQLPPNLPPIAAAISTEGSAYRVDGYLPAQLVQSLVAAGMQAFMAMQGGGGGAQPGGPGGL